MQVLLLNPELLVLCLAGDCGAMVWLRKAGYLVLYLFLFWRKRSRRLGFRYYPSKEGLVGDYSIIKLKIIIWK